jgi:hypothetical protein
VFNLFKFKKSPVIEDVVAKEPSPAPMPLDAQQQRVALAEPVALVSQVQATAPESGQVSDQPAEPMSEATGSLLGQMDTMKSTREDVIAAYKIFLGRLPESMEVVDPRVGVSPAALLVDFLISKEFPDQASKSQLVLAVAKKILDERKQASATEGAAPGAEAAAP